MLSEAVRRDVAIRRKFNYVIWKESLPLHGKHVFECPASADLIAVGMQGAGQPVLWYRCQPHMASDMKQKRAVYLIYTGEKYDYEIVKYVGTIQIPDGLAAGHSLVLHVFDGGSVRE